MSKILQFPETRRIQVNLQAERDNLKILYDSLKQCYEHIEEIEKRIQWSEQSYDLAFAQYAKARGLDNVEVEYFEWVSGEISVNIETGEVKYDGKTIKDPDPPEDPEPRGSA